MKEFEHLTEEEENPFEEKHQWLMGELEHLMEEVEIRRKALMVDEEA